MNSLIKDIIETYWYNLPQAWWKAYELNLLSQIDLQSPIMDLGCGDGRFTELMAKTKKQIIVGVDAYFRDLRKAIKLNLYTGLAKGDARNLPFQRDSFSTVISVCVIEHIPDITLVISEVYKILKKDGLFVFTVPTSEFTEVLFFVLFWRKVGFIKLSEMYARYKNKKLTHINYLSLENWKSLLKKEGFDILTFRFYFPLKDLPIWDIWQEMFDFGFPACLSCKGTYRRGKLNISNFLNYLNKILAFLKINVIKDFMCAFFGFYLEKNFRQRLQNKGGGLMVIAVKR